MCIIYAWYNVHIHVLYTCTCTCMYIVQVYIYHVDVVLLCKMQQFLFKISLNSWKPPRYISVASSSRHERIRNKWHILTEGEDLPPPIKTFKV